MEVACRQSKSWQPMDVASSPDFRARIQDPATNGYSQADSCLQGTFSVLLFFLKNITDLVCPHLSTQNNCYRFYKNLVKTFDILIAVN